MFWEDCKEPSFYKHICKPENFMYLNGKNVIYPRVAEIVHKYIERIRKTLINLRKSSSKTRKYFSLSIPVPTMRSIALSKNEVSSSGTTSS